MTKDREKYKGRKDREKYKKREAKPKKIDVVEEMDKIERRESLAEGGSKP